ncbi:MAG: hypothetical protein AAF658_09655 [Myxococcota bacterium]
MFVENPSSAPVRETLHWVEQACFYFFMLVGIGLAFYAQLAPDATYSVATRSIQLVQAPANVLLAEAELGGHHAS